MATDNYSALLKLTAPQAVALDALDAGATHSEAADAAGVHRVTVTRWANYHPEFIAETNRRRTQRAELLAVRSESVTLSALDLVARACEEGDKVTALGWLRLVGLAGLLEAERTRGRSSPMSGAEVLAAEASAEGVGSLDALTSGMYRERAAQRLSDNLREDSR